MVRGAMVGATIIMRRIKAKVISLMRRIAYTHPILQALIRLYYAYRLYSRTRHTFGTDTVICSVAPIGTGDYYFAGMYMGEWLKQNNITEWVMLCENKTVLKVTGLFKIFDNHTYVPPQQWTIHNMRKLIAFCNIPDYHYFHYAHSSLDYAGLCVMQPKPSRLFGYKGLEMLDLYIHGAWFLPRQSPYDSPVFNYTDEDMQNALEYLKADPQKCVLISPYSASYREHLPPLSFWENIVKHLNKCGYTVFTNCAGREKAIKRTRKYLVPYNVSVPILNQMGGFIGIRSGLCDIVSTATCKKIVLHPYGGRNWPPGTSLAFTGLNNMGLCNDALEYEFEPCWDNLDYVFEKVIGEFV